MLDVLSGERGIRTYSITKYRRISKNPLFKGFLEILKKYNIIYFLW